MIITDRRPRLNTNTNHALIRKRAWLICAGSMPGQGEVAASGKPCNETLIPAQCAEEADQVGLAFFHIAAIHCYMVPSK